MAVKGCTMFGGSQGPWRTIAQRTVTGAGLAPITHLHVGALDDDGFYGESWKLRGFISNVRYVEQVERRQLVARQEGLGRVDATYAALLPIKKTQAWWDMSQDERRHIFEDQSKHIEANMKYLPAIARQLYHSRDIGEEFDFLTWFEFRPEHVGLFDEMIQGFRESLEWKYVDREVDLRFEKRILPGP